MVAGQKHIAELEMLEYIGTLHSDLYLCLVIELHDTQCKIKIYELHKYEINEIIYDFLIADIIFSGVITMVSRGL